MALSPMSFSLNPKLSSSRHRRSRKKCDCRLSRRLFVEIPFHLRIKTVLFLTVTTIHGFSFPIQQLLTIPRRPSRFKRQVIWEQIFNRHDSDQSKRCSRDNRLSHYERKTRAKDSHDDPRDDNINDKNDHSQFSISNNFANGENHQHKSEHENIDGVSHEVLVTTQQNSNDCFYSDASQNEKNKNSKINGFHSFGAATIDNEPKKSDQKLRNENEILRRRVKDLEDENFLLRHEVSSRIVLEQFEGERIRHDSTSNVIVPNPNNRQSTTSIANYSNNNENYDSDLMWCDELEDGQCPVEPAISFGEALRDRAYWLVGLLALQSCSGLILARNEALLENHPFSTYIAYFNLSLTYSMLYVLSIELETLMLSCFVHSAFCTKKSNLFLNDACWCWWECR